MKTFIKTAFKIIVVIGVITIILGINMYSKLPPVYQRSSYAPTQFGDFYERHQQIVREREMALSLEFIGGGTLLFIFGLGGEFLYRRRLKRKLGNEPVADAQSG